MMNFGRVADVSTLPRLGGAGVRVAILACMAIGVAEAPIDKAFARVAQEEADNQDGGGKHDPYADFLVKYVDWAKSIEAQGQQRGTPLNPEQLELAIRIGIQQPEKVRLVFVDEIPFPTHDADMRQVGESLGFIGSGVTNNAQAFGYTVWVRKGFVLDRPRLAHELVHVAQIERSASFGAYASAYIDQLRKFGHANMPLEREAYEANRKYGCKGNQG